MARANSSLRRLLHAALAALAVAFPLACDNAVPHVKGGREPVLPPGPQREVQALSSPTTSNAEGGSGSDAYCLDAQLTEQSYNEDTGEFSSVYQCAPGGGVASVSSQGVQDANGDGSYDQTTVLENGDSVVWHFTFDTSDDFITQSYTGIRDDESENYSGVYTARDDGDWDSTETWNMREGTYLISGVQSQDGLAFDGHESFDDPNTDASPDWELDYVSSPDGTFSQTVHFEGDGYTSDYDYSVALDGSSLYTFETDLLDSDVEPDYEGTYAYLADGSGEGNYLQHFDDDSLLTVQDEIHADGTVTESWSFDDATTDLELDQEGEMSYALDGSADGSFTLHSEGGGSQTCHVHLDADGTQTIDQCDEV